MTQYLSVNRFMYSRPIMIYSQKYIILSILREWAGTKHGYKNTNGSPKHFVGWRKSGIQAKLSFSDKNKNSYLWWLRVTGKVTWGNCLKRGNFYLDWNVGYMNVFIYPNLSHCTAGDLRSGYLTVYQLCLI